MICPRCLEELNIETQMKIEEHLLRCVLCGHKELKGKEDECTRPN